MFSSSHLIFIVFVWTYTVRDDEDNINVLTYLLTYLLTHLLTYSLTYLLVSCYRLVY